MKHTAADILIDTIAEWGVEVIFGMPGDGINGIMEALRKRQERIRFIQVRHEEAAAFMACAYAKYTGKLGVCLATSGPGGLHLLNGLYDAKLEGQPVLAITGHHFHDLIDTHAQQDISLDRVFADVAVYNTRVMGASHVESVADLACRTAFAYRGVAHINFPVDIQEHEGGERSKRNVAGHTSDVFARSARLPDACDLQRAAAVLNAGRKIAILVGQGANGAVDELAQVAERLGAPIIKTVLGKAAIPDDHPYTTGGIGLLGTKPSQEAIEQCDTLLMVGTSFPYIEFLPKPGQARAVQVDIDAARIGLRYPVEVGLVSDGRRTLQELLPLLTRNEDRKFLKQAQAGMQQWWTLMEGQGTRSDVPMKPQVVAWELGKRLSDTAIVSSDSGTITTWFARHILAKRGQKFSLSGKLASMANGLCYAIAAQVAFPDRQCVAFVGDGGFSMLMGEFATAVKYRLPIKVVVVKNNSLGMIKWEQMVFLGNPNMGASCSPSILPVSPASAAGRGSQLRTPLNAARILDHALATPGPVIIEAVVDPFEPPMPPKVTLEQATKFALSLARGEPNRERIAFTVLADKVRELI